MWGISSGSWLQQVLYQPYSMQKPRTTSSSQISCLQHLWECQLPPAAPLGFSHFSSQGGRNQDASRGKREEESWRKHFPEQSPAAGWPMEGFGSPQLNSWALRVAMERPCSARGASQVAALWMLPCSADLLSSSASHSRSQSQNRELESSRLQQPGKALRAQPAAAVLPPSPGHSGPAEGRGTGCLNISHRKIWDISLPRWLTRMLNQLERFY